MARGRCDLIISTWRWSMAQSHFIAGTSPQAQAKMTCVVKNIWGSLLWPSSCCKITRGRCNLIISTWRWSMAQSHFIAGTSLQAQVQMTSIVKNIWGSLLWPRSHCKMARGRCDLFISTWRSSMAPSHFIVGAWYRPKHT